MSRRLMISRSCLLLVLAAALGAGCNPHSLPPMAPVKGTVTLDGQPVTAGQVSFIPTDKTDTAGLSSGTIGTDGAYEIHTGGASGAPLGKYKVTVTTSTVPVPGATTMPMAAWGAQYKDPMKTPLNFEVVNNPEAGRYDLKLTK